MVIWSKTDAGRLEMQSRTYVKERAQRNLLLVIDGHKTEESLLSGLAGISSADFEILRSMGLIAPVAPAPARSRPAPLAHSHPVVTAPGALAPRTSARPPARSGDPAEQSEALDYSEFTAALTQMISKELGLRGFVLSLAVEKAGTNEELQAVAQRTLAQIAERKGDAAADAARRTLYGR